MALDVNKAVESVARLGPGHFVAVLALAMVCGAGYVVHDGLNQVHVGLVELTHAVEQSTTDANRRAEDYGETQERILGLLTAVCYATANSDDTARRRCEDAAR